MTEVGIQWIEDLRGGGYEHHCQSWTAFWRLKCLPGIIVRKLMKLGQVSRVSRIVEFGCGGAGKLVPFALMGCETLGIDVSPDVLKRAARFRSEVERYASSRLRLELVESDILKLNIQELRGEGFDLVFSSGVIEHFLEERQRLLALLNMNRMAKSGGWVINIVPSGIHPKRSYMKATKSGGYNIPEIDYTPGMLMREMQETGLVNTGILGYNLLGYLPWTVKPAQRYIAFLLNKLARVALEPFLPETVRQRFGYVLIAVGQVPKTRPPDGRGSSPSAGGMVYR